MKVLVISSSPNKIGLTNLCVDICIETLKTYNVKAEWICLNNYNIKKCEACGYRGWGNCLEGHTCKIDDDFNELQEYIQDYDAIVVISPVYFYEMSESAKVFFDRLKRCQSFNKDFSLKGKKMLCIACAGGSGDGTENTLNSMKILAKFLHMDVVNYIGITKKNFEDNKEIIKESTIKLIGNKIHIEEDIIKELIKRIHENSNIQIKKEKYTVKSKTWYVTQEDENTEYIKCELNNNKVLVIIPEDHYIYLGEVIENMKYRKISEGIIVYNGIKYNKTGEGHQYIKEIEFGDINKIEGKCKFEDYESENNIISLGILTEQNIRADVYAEILTTEDIKILK